MVDTSLEIKAVVVNKASIRQDSIFWWCHCWKILMLWQSFKTALQQTNGGKQPPCSQLMCSRYDVKINSTEAIFHSIQARRWVTNDQEICVFSQLWRTKKQKLFSRLFRVDMSGLICKAWVPAKGRSRTMPCHCPTCLKELMLGLLFLRRRGTILSKKCTYIHSNAIPNAILSKEKHLYFVAISLFVLFYPYPLDSSRIGIFAV